MSFNGINHFLSSGMRPLRHHPFGCDICHSNFADSNRPFDIHSPVQIRCGHVFGKSCLSDWVHNTTQANHNKCPICLVHLFDNGRPVNPSGNTNAGTNALGRIPSGFTPRRQITTPQRETSRQVPSRYPPAPTAETPTPSEDSLYGGSLRRGSAHPAPTQRQVPSRYPPAPTAGTPTPSEDSFLGRTLRRVTARIPSQRPAVQGNDTPYESRDLPRGESRSNVVYQGTSRSAPQGLSRDQPRLVPHDPPRFESRPNAVVPQGTSRSAPQGPSRDQPRFESRPNAVVPQRTPPQSASQIPPRPPHLRVTILDPARPGIPLPTRPASPVPSTPSTNRTDMSSIRCEVYVDARQYSNHYTYRPEDDGTDSGSSTVGE